MALPGCVRGRFRATHGEREAARLHSDCQRDQVTANGLKPSNVVSVLHTFGQTLLLLQDCFPLPSIHGSFGCESTAVLLVVGNDMRAYRAQALLLLSLLTEIRATGGDIHTRNMCYGNAVFLTFASLLVCRRLLGQNVLGGFQRSAQLRNMFNEHAGDTLGQPLPQGTLWPSGFERNPPADNQPALPGTVWFRIQLVFLLDDPCPIRFIPAASANNHSHELRTRSVCRLPVSNVAVNVSL